METQPVDNVAVEDAVKESCPIAVVRKLKALSQRTSSADYPPISSIPRTSPERLALAAEEPVEGDEPKATTHLYLAYGSNLAAETFLGVRGIRPLSQVNVSVPTLDLKFNLAGIPYREPCFANVDFRKIPDHPKLPPKVPPINPPPFEPPHATVQWDEGLVGVVYEVTEEDYRTIIRTEGGGVGYKEISVPCLTIPPKISIPEKPFPGVPKPFIAKTLFAPQIPDSDLPDDPRKKKWWYRFLVGPQRDPDYSQASARYLKLITDGAKEHELPDGYQRWLNSLQPYTITTWRQQIGALLFALSNSGIFLIIIFGSKLFPSKDGKMPRWLAIMMTVLFNIIWMSYDVFYKPTFGDGERTEDGEEKNLDSVWSSWKSEKVSQVDEEKVGLLSEYE